MLDRLLGSDSIVHDIRGGLDRSTAAVRGVAGRIAAAGAADPGAFAEALDDAEEARPTTRDVDLETEMVDLAEQQIRFDAQARMLEKMYERIRLSVRGG